MRRILVGGIPVFRIFLATRVGVSGLQLLHLPLVLLQLLDNLSQGFAREVFVCCCSGLCIYKRHSLKNV